MLIQENVIKNMVLGSIRSSARIGKVSGLLINPHNLHIDALFCQVINSKGTLLLVPEDIRDISPVGVVINDHEHLLDASDAIRLKPILDLNFEIIGLKAYVGKRHVGSVESFAVESDGLYVQKIYVRPTLVKRINSSRLTFDRSMVVEVSNRAVVFKDSSKQRAPSRSQPKPTWPTSIATPMCPHDC